MTDLLAALAPLPALVVGPTDGEQASLSTEDSASAFAFPEKVVNMHGYPATHDLAHRAIHVCTLAGVRIGWRR